MSESILVERDGAVGIVTLNRPAALNALDVESTGLLLDALSGLDADPTVNVLLLTAAGERAFSVGADLRDPRGAGGDGSRPRPPTRSVFELRLAKPLVAAVHGYCLGAGFHLLLTSDLRLATPEASFGLPEVNIGLLAELSTQLLRRQVPYAVAMQLLLTGERIDAQEAYRAGLVNRLVPFSELRAEALELARKLAAKPPLALRAIKEATFFSYAAHPLQGLYHARALQGALRASEDRAEAVRAFKEKRPGVFKGR